MTINEDRQAIYEPKIYSTDFTFSVVHPHGTVALGKSVFGVGTNASGRMKKIREVSIPPIVHALVLQKARPFNKQKNIYYVIKRSSIAYNLLFLKLTLGRYYAIGDSVPEASEEGACRATCKCVEGPDGEAQVRKTDFGKFVDKLQSLIHLYFFFCKEKLIFEPFIVIPEP